MLDVRDPSQAWFVDRLEGSIQAGTIIQQACVLTYKKWRLLSRGLEGAFQGCFLGQVLWQILLFDED
jgi:hypothetical protein